MRRTWASTARACSARRMAAGGGARRAAAVFGEAHGGGGGDEAFAGTDEQLGAKVGGEVVQLEANGAGREEHFLGGASDAGEFHDGEKELKLAEFHDASVT